MALALSGFCMISDAAMGQSVDDAISRADAVVRARFANIVRYTVTEHYAVYRNGAWSPLRNGPFRPLTKRVRAPVTRHFAKRLIVVAKPVIEPSLASDQHINDPVNASAVDAHYRQL